MTPAQARVLLITMIVTLCWIASACVTFILWVDYQNQVHPAMTTDPVPVCRVVKP